MQAKAAEAVATIYIQRNEALADDPVHYQVIAVSESVVITINMPVDESVDDAVSDVTTRAREALLDVFKSIN